MSDYPLEPLGNICEINPDTLAEASDPTRRYRYIDLSSIKEQKTDLRITPLPFAVLPSRARRRVAFNDVLLGTVRPNLKNFAIIESEDNDLLCSTGFAVLRSKKNISDPRFIFHVINSEIATRQLNALVTGSNYPAVNATQVADLLLPIPPLPEQKKIAEILSGIDKAIEARKRTADKITTTCHFVADEILQQAKYTYGSIKIKDCANRLWQGINTAADRVEYHERGVPILQAKHITSGQIDSGGARFLCEGDYSRYSCRFQPSVGDILFTNIGTIGKSAIVTTPSKFLVAWNIFLISPSDAIESEYLHCFMQVLDQQNYFHQHAAGNATKFINKTLISELEVPLPPREEQIKICARIKALSRAAKCSQDAASKHLELKTSLSADLLSGRMRVSI